MYYKSLEYYHSVNKCNKKCFWKKLNVVFQQTVEKPEFHYEYQNYDDNFIFLKIIFMNSRF